MDICKELALLYVQHHMTYDTTPKELLIMFCEAEEQIAKCYKEQHKDKFIF